MTKRDSQIQNDMLAELAWEPSIDAAAISVELNDGIVTEAPAVTDVQTEGWVRMIRGGDRVLIRPLHSQDAEMERRFIEAMSPVARRFRFLETMRTPSEELLKQLTVLDPWTDAAFVAVMVTGSREDPIGVGRFTPTGAATTASSLSPWPTSGSRRDSGRC